MCIINFACQWRLSKGKFAVIIDIHGRKKKKASAVHTTTAAHCAPQSTKYPRDLHLQALHVSFPFQHGSTRHSSYVQACASPLPEEDLLCCYKPSVWKRHVKKSGARFDIPVQVSVSRYRHTYFSKVRCFIRVYASAFSFLSSTNPSLSTCLRDKCPMLCIVEMICKKSKKVLRTRHRSHILLCF